MYHAYLDILRTERCDVVLESEGIAVDWQAVSLDNRWLRALRKWSAKHRDGKPARSLPGAPVR